MNEYTLDCFVGAPEHLHSSSICDLVFLFVMHSVLLFLILNIVQSFARI